MRGVNKAVSSRDAGRAISMLRNFRFLMSALIFGVLISVGPPVLWPLFILVFVFLEKVRIKRHGFKKVGFARIGVMGCVVLAAYFAPFKYVDHMVNPAELEFYSGPNGTLLTGDRVNMFLPAGVTEGGLNLGKEVLSLRTLISKIEQATGSSHMLRYCGNGVTLLRGASPIGVIRFFPKALKNENVAKSGVALTQ